ncbi:glutamine synthetase family protein [Pseudoponticoccus marisrubri]|uniref:GS catalytic domain-containing protein n=1 Tax=Pseudoponticoccus marisrubri TaxID=1685382 RepID=A0A0W7WK91_9RHOB|nr:glutamine synthetase family protein [Pseudoponticoccus marisrubri]KUF10948.1 hypothetical protein AVJ23_10995 [Pseudoponticoccus marisrubri]
MPTPLIMACTSDLSGLVRGKGFALADLERRIASGVGWTPTNAQITCFDGIAPSPFGSLGDVVLWPDADTVIEAPIPDAPPLRMVLGDIRERDGAAWMACARGHLRAAIDRFHAATGADLRVSFEHEFTLSGLEGGAGFSLEGFHAAQPFAEDLLQALTAAGMEPDSFLREYGPGQFEVTLAPKPALRAADEAIALREITRAVARAHGRRASFAPLPDADTVGNGVHIHLSLWDGDTPLTHDPEGPAGLSPRAAQAAAGIVAHMPALCALTAASVASYHRLTPHRWSAAYANLAVQDREAGLRICPVTATDPARMARQFNYEYRAADATASPWLALSALIHAAAAGVEDALPCPAPTTGDLSERTDDALRAEGIDPLPRSLPQALETLQASPALAAWYGAPFLSLYADHKRHEAGEVAGLELAEMLNRYADVY